MGSVDRLRVSVDEEPQVVAVAAERIGVSLVADWRLDGSTGIRVEQSDDDGGERCAADDQFLSAAE